MSEPTRTEQVTVDGGRFDLHVWLPPQPSGPGVLLLQEIFGVGAYIKAVAARLARDGYVVGAPDLFWRIRPGFAAEHDEAGMAEAFEMVGKFDVEQGRGRRGGGARDAEGTRRGAGRHRRARLLPRRDDRPTSSRPRAIPTRLVSYYGSGVAESIGRLADITCPVLYHFGGNDDFIPAEQVQTVVEAVEASGRDDLRVDVHAAAGHAFDNHEAAMFHDVDAAAAAWATTMTFLAEHTRR